MITKYISGEEPEVGDVVRRDQDSHFGCVVGDVARVVDFGGSPLGLRLDCHSHDPDIIDDETCFTLIARAGEPVKYQPGDVVECIKSGIFMGQRCGRGEPGERFTVTYTTGYERSLLSFQGEGIDGNDPARFRLVHRPAKAEAKPTHDFQNGDKVVFWPTGYDYPSGISRSGLGVAWIGTITDASTDPIKLDWSNGHKNETCAADKLRPLTDWQPESGARVLSSSPLRAGDVILSGDWFGKFYTTGKFYVIEERNGELGTIRDDTGDFDADLHGTLSAGQFTFIGRPDADGWMAWAGGECPLPGVAVEIKRRFGLIQELTPSERSMCWTHSDNDPDQDITHFRIAPAKVEAKPAKPARHVGEQITVTDARGVRGPGEVIEVRKDGSFKVHVGWRHRTQCGQDSGPHDWFFLADETSDFGLTLEFTPLIEPVRTIADVARNLRPGQRVRVAGEGTALPYGGIMLDETATLEALPDPLKVGDKVKSKRGWEGEILAEDGGVFWIRWDRGGHGNCEAASLERV